MSAQAKQHKAAHHLITNHQPTKEKRRKEEIKVSVEDLKNDCINCILQSGNSRQLWFLCM